MVYEPISKLSNARSPILPGRRLGPYEILAAIGAGGMGEVYKARDTRLNRIVAIKVLPVHLADRAELRERFEREARTVASLNHPHICVLHDVGQQDGTDYLVMEHLEGETLAQRLQKGPLSLEQVLQYAIEIADALDKAHRKGVTHRDLKPGNIMLTKTGTKLLDFGLAKLKHEGPSTHVQLSELSTASDPITAQGTIVGTLQYMAPEQLEGKEVDARTDIFAFGAVVYEMATGKKCFEGKSQASLIAAILQIDPPSMSSLQPMAPVALDRTIKICFAKDPDGRWQAANDLTRELKWIAEGGSQAGVSPPPATAKGIRSLGRRERILSVGALLLVAAIVGIAAWNLKPPPPRAVTRAVINLPAGQQLAGLDSGPSVALSPDGTHLAYVARQGGVQQLYLRAVDSLEAKPIPGTDGVINPFFSPDGQWVGFFASGKLKKTSVSGGAALTLGDVAANPYGASWGGQGTIAFAPTTFSVLQQVSESGGTSQPLTRLEKNDVSQRWPEFLPGGKALLFAASPAIANWVNAQVAVQSVGTGERRNLIQGGTYPHYAPSGHLVYVQGGSLMAVPFDAQRLAVTGTPVPVVEGVLESPSTGAAQYSISSTGTLVYIPGTVQSNQSELVWVSRSGAEQPLAARARAYRGPRLSPDGRRVAVTIQEQESQVWLYDISLQTLTRLTFGGNTNNNPSWTPDGKRIAFESNKEGPLNVFWQLADGSGGLERLTTSEYVPVPHSWSPDGQLMAFVEVNPSTGYDIWILRMGDPSPGSGQVPLAGSGQVRKAQPFLRTRFDEAVPRFSPDGRWLAYVSNESGRSEIYVQPYPGPGGKWQISTDGGTEPVWNPSGRELFYRTGDKMIAVEITTQPSFSVGKPRMLFEGRYRLTRVTSPNYDVSRDGQRFLMLKPVEQAQAASTQINVVLNWFEELKRRVPKGAR
jgi:Tol biopolymer transport system component/tRNA A-37 threonylcarbamoyl transferase component Bud32